MRLLIRPAPERGRAFASLVTLDLGGCVLAKAEIPLDPDSLWVRTVASHFASVSAGEITRGRFLRDVRDARTAERAARWPR